MIISDEECKRLQALEAKATQGKWLASGGEEPWDAPLLCGYDYRPNHATPAYFSTGPRVKTCEQAEADERLTVASRNALPLLLDSVARLKEALAIAIDYVSSRGRDVDTYDAAMARIRELVGE